MIDTNIIISAALYRRGGIASLLEDVLSKFQVCICDFSIEEMEIVIQSKFFEHKNEMNVFLNGLTYELIYTPEKINIDKYAVCAR